MSASINPFHSLSIDSVDASDFGNDSINHAEENYSTERGEWLNRVENDHADRIFMNNLVMNYLVVEGYHEAVNEFRKEAEISRDYVLDAVKERIKIRMAIECGNISEAITLMNHFYADLMDSNYLLVFHLRKQEFIELVKDKKLEDALSYAQNHLCEYGENNEQIKEELERSMALLAFDDPFQSPFSDLLQPLQRHKLSSEINSAILDYENLESNAKLNILIKMLLWSQDLLDKRSVVYPKMIDIANARIEEANQVTSI